MASSSNREPLIPGPPPDPDSCPHCYLPSSVSEPCHIHAQLASPALLLRKLHFHALTGAFPTRDPGPRIATLHYLGKPWFDDFLTAVGSTLEGAMVKKAMESEEVRVGTAWRFLEGGLWTFAESQAERKKLREAWRVLFPFVERFVVVAVGVGVGVWIWRRGR